jgi:hypothetical protein
MSNVLYVNLDKELENNCMNIENGYGIIMANLLLYILINWLIFIYLFLFIYLFTFYLFIYSFVVVLFCISVIVNISIKQTLACVKYTVYKSI